MGPSTVRLVLASGSRGRRELMTLHGYSFEIMPANIDEPTAARLGNCEHYVAELAWLKAQAVQAKVPAGTVIAADTVGWIDGEVIGKPDDAAHAKAIIQQLQGRTHELWTGVCLWHKPTDLQVMWQERSLVAMKALSNAEIEAYLSTRLWEGCSGAYAIQMPTDPYLTVVEGSTSNVIGLPMESLANHLKLFAP
jgi:septum formation protein